MKSFMIGLLCSILSLIAGLFIMFSIDCINLATVPGMSKYMKRVGNIIA